MERAEIESKFNELLVSELGLDAGKITQEARFEEDLEVDSLGVVELLEHKPDFVLSGINAGANTGVNVLYSGTVAGAIEAAFFGIPSMAFSLELSDELDFHRAGRIARAVFQQYAACEPRPGMRCSTAPLQRSTPSRN